MSVVSTSEYSVGSNPTMRPSDFVLPFGPGQIGGEEEALARDDLGLGNLLEPLGQPVADRLLRALAGRESGRLHRQVAREGSVELVGDRAQEARAEAVHGDDQGQPDEKRGGGRRGAPGIGARGVGGEPALDREDLPDRPREDAHESGGPRTGRPSRSRRRSRWCRSCLRPQRSAWSPRPLPARRRRRGRARSAPHRRRHGGRAASA